MKILFAIAVVSFAALAWAALAIAGHIRKSTSRSGGDPAETSSGLEMAQAIDLRLADVSRRKPIQPATDSAPAGPQDFSYFNKETTETGPRKTFPNTEAPTSPATADRS